MLPSESMVCLLTQAERNVIRAIAEKLSKVVGYQGAGTGRPIYEYTFNGQTHRMAITVGDNGFIVGANPTSLP